MMNGLTRNQRRFSAQISERVIVACVERHSNSGPAALARTILETLWEAGYDVTHRPDAISD